MVVSLSPINAKCIFGNILLRKMYCYNYSSEEIGLGGPVLGRKDFFPFVLNFLSATFLLPCIQPHAHYFLYTSMSCYIYFELHFIIQCTKEG